MKTDETIEETAAEPVVDMAEAEQAKRQAEAKARAEAEQAEQERLHSQMLTIIAEQAVTAAANDAALAAVKAACDAERSALKELEDAANA